MFMYMLRPKAGDKVFIGIETDRAVFINRLRTLGFDIPDDATEDVITQECALYNMWNTSGRSVYIDMRSEGFFGEFRLGSLVRSKEKHQ